MAENATLVSLPQLADIALNCPEMGVVNFNILHTLIHVLLQQLSIMDVAIEFRGTDSDQIQNLIKNSKRKEGTPFSKYEIIGGAATKRKGSKTKKSIALQDIKERMTNEVNKEQELRVIDRRKDSKEDPIPNPLPLKSPPVSAMPSETGIQTVVIVESSSKLPLFSVAITKRDFEDLQEDVTSLKRQVNELTELPANMGLIEATRTPNSPILDMFQILHLTKRMDATETGIEKMVSLIEDLAKQITPSNVASIMDKTEDIRASVDVQRTPSRTEIMVALEERVKNIEQVITELTQGGTTKRLSIQSQHADVQKSQSQKSDIKVVETEQSSPGNDEDDVKVVKGPQRSGSIQQGVKIEFNREQSDFKTSLEGVSLADLPPNEAFALIQKEFQQLKEWIENNSYGGVLIQEIENIKSHLLAGGGTGGAGGEDGLGQGKGGQIQLTEGQFTETVKQVKEMDEIYNNQIGMLNDQLTNLQKEVNGVLTKIDIILPGGDSVAINAETTMELANKLVLLEKEMVTIAETAAKLEMDKEEREKAMEAIVEQIDILKIVKANREDLEEALGDKADACMINRKVSHDQFETACDDLSKGIEEALDKLQEQEEMWKQALDAIQKEVGNKLDKMEVDPLRDFVNSKLKALQDKFKSLAALKREQEAAGTKTKLLRDVNCISCDKDVVMRREMDPALRPKPHALAPTRNMAPYLAYELDQLRKQQKCVPGSKNLNFFESALKTRGQREKDHICNRYCGGSHTVTTPQQRVTRLGHFLEQWGPEISPVNEEYVRGVDNHMYKARDDSIQKKGSRTGSIAEGKDPIKSTSEEIATKDTAEVPPDRDTLVNASLQEMLSKQAAERSKSIDSKKVHSIGSTGRYSANKVEGSLTGIKTSVSQEVPTLQENRASKVSKTSQDTFTKARASKVNRASVEAAMPTETRNSQEVSPPPQEDTEPTERRGSKASRTSKTAQEIAPPPRTSVNPPPTETEPRKSQDNRASQDRKVSQDNRASQDRKVSQDNRASQDKRVSQEKRQSQEKRASQANRISQGSLTAKPPGSDAKQSGAKIASELKVKTSDSAPPAEPAATNEEPAPTEAEPAATNSEPAPTE